jgi:phenylacetate-CoA ligase
MYLFACLFNNGLHGTKLLASSKGKESDITLFNDHKTSLPISENSYPVSLVQKNTLKSGKFWGLGLCKYPNIVMGNMAYVVAGISSRFPSFFSHTPECVLFSLSRLQAKKIFWNTYTAVPAYKDFIKNQCPESLPPTLDAVPVMSKSNYIKKYAIVQTLLKGKFPEQGQIDTSTGTSGTPTMWIRGHQEMKHVKNWIRIASETALGNDHYIFCNMFALGPWATGMTSAYALSGDQMVLSIGPDIEKLYQALQELGNKNKYVIAGYPPHMKKLVENVPFDLHDYDITMVVGGEAMSDNVYESIKRGGVKEIYSSYGASDLRINIGQQTQFEQQLQWFCKENQDFKQELLGSLEGTPIFFHYNPLLDYIEETKEGELLFTDLDSKRVSPRVRYRLGDRGRVIELSKVKRLLKKYNYPLTPRTTLPLICLYGRGDEALTFNGCNLMYDDLERALIKIPGLYSHVNRYAYNKYENKSLDQQLEFWIELKPNINLQELNIPLDELNQHIIDALGTVNQDFKFQIGCIEDNSEQSLIKPRTFLYKYGESPMVEQGPHHKNKYVYDLNPSL